MRIEFTGRQTQVPNSVRVLAERRLRKLAKALPRISSAHVVLARDRHRHTVEVTLHSPHLDLAATEAATEFRAALRAALGKIERQAQRQRGRWQERKRRTSAPTKLAAAPAAPAPPADALRVVRARRAAVKAMSIEEAVLEMEGRDERPLVFRDARSDVIKVLFKRGDGHLGLIEPEL